MGDGGGIVGGGGLGWGRVGEDGIEGGREGGMEGLID